MDGFATIQVKTGEVVNLPSGRIIATDVSEDEYMDQYAADFCEWVDGVVIKMMPVTQRHDMLTRYAAMLLEAYFALKPIGRIHQAPFVQNLTRRREPDIMVILENNPHPVHPTSIEGPADICIEVVSEDSIARDYGEKFREYEKGGVREYWIFDPLRKQSRFFRLDENGVYRAQQPDEAGNYRTPLLPGLVIYEPDLWRVPLPHFYAIAEAMKKMLVE